MMDAMGSFRIDVAIGNPAQPGVRREIRNVLVDTGAELFCFPGDVLESLGIARDLVLLGARSLEGLNLRIDPVHKVLIDGGPMPLAAAS